MASPNKTPPSATVPPPLPPSRPAPAPAPPPPRGGANTTRSPRRDFKGSSGVIAGPQKIIIYGPGGIGKTSLIASLEQVGIVPKIIDLDDGSKNLPVSRIGPDEVTSWEDMRDALHMTNLWSGVGAVVVDSGTKAEEHARAWVLANIKHEKGHTVQNIEGYGFGKGYTYIFETFLQLLADLDAHVRQGRHAILICHDCVSKAPNPAGDDWLRYEPRLQASDKSSIRNQCKEWADHLLFVGYDVAVNEGGKGIGAGTRTIYANELPTWMAKSRLLSEPIPYEKGSPALWQQLFQHKGE